MNGTPENLPIIGKIISQTTSMIKISPKGYIAAYDQETNVLKYYQDRSLYLTNAINTVDSSAITNSGQLLPFESSGISITAENFEGSIDTTLMEVTIY